MMLKYYEDCQLMVRQKAKPYDSSVCKRLAGNYENGGAIHETRKRSL